MMRFAILLFWFWAASISPSWSAGEIGYVEDFTGLASRYRVTHDGHEIPMRLCLPLYVGDTIEALDDKARATLRMIDHPEPVAWSRGDRDTKLTTSGAGTSFLSDLMNSTLAALSPFDEQKRDRVLTTIRGDGGGEFGVPLLESRQTISLGQKTIAVGWLPASTLAEISITDKKGKALVSKSKASGGIWLSPSLNLKPGQYRVTLVAGGSKVAGDIDVVDALQIPHLPAELTQENIPQSLRHTAQAVWLAAQSNGQYRLEALQLVANDRSTRSAAVLTEALIAGKTIELPK